MLTRFVGAQSLAIATAIVGRFVLSAMEGGHDQQLANEDGMTMLALFHAAEAGLLGQAYAMGGPTHSLLLPVIGWHGVQSAVMLFSGTVLLRKINRRLGAAPHVE